MAGRAGGWRLAAGGWRRRRAVAADGAGGWRFEARAGAAHWNPEPDRLQPPASASVRSTMPEGDTIYRSAQTLDRALRGARRHAFRHRCCRPSTRIDEDATARRPHHRARVVAGEAPPDPVLGRPRAAHAHAHERLVAHLPARRTVAAAAVSGAARDRDRCVRGRRLQCAGGRVLHGPGAEARACVAGPRSRPAGRDLRRGRRRRTAAGARAARRSATRCSISGRWRESATSTSRRSASSAASTRSRRSIACRTMTLRALVQTARRLLQANVAPGTDAGIATYHPLRRTTGRRGARGAAMGVRPCATPLPPVPDAGSNGRSKGPTHGARTGALSVRGRRSSSGVSR